MNPLDLSEIPEKENSLIPLWLRGGFPDSFLAENDIDSFVFRENFIQTYLERDVPQFVVYSEESQYPINKDVEAIGLYQLISILEKI